MISRLLDIEENLTASRSTVNTMIQKDKAGFSARRSVDETMISLKIQNEYAHPLRENLGPLKLSNGGIYTG